MKFSTILAISFFLVALAGSLISGTFYFYQGRNYLENQINNHLETIADERVRHIQTFLESKKDRAIDFSSDGFIRDSLIRLEKGAGPSQIAQDLTNYLMVNKLPIDENFYEVYVLDADGGVVAETEHEQLEEPDYTKDPLFLEGRKNPYFKEVFYDKEFGIKGIAISAPILKEKELLGVVVIKMYIDSLSEITADVTGLGETGEVYIINKDSFLITPSRFLKGETKGILTQVVDTENSENCFNMEITDEHGGHDPTVPFLNYRGEETKGTHRHFVEMEWCLLVEMEKSEVLDIPLKNFIKNQAIVSALVAMILTSIGFSVGSFLDKKYSLIK